MRFDPAYFRHAVGNHAPVEPFALNRASPHARDLRLWFPITSFDSLGGIKDLSGHGLHATTNNFEAANFTANAFGGRALNLNAGGASDNDSIAVAADPKIAINANAFTFSIWCNLRSYGVGGFSDFGRILYKGTGVDWRFDAATGSFGQGAGVRLYLNRRTSGTSQEKGGGTNAEVPLNRDILITLTHDGGLAHSGIHIYVNGVEITYVSSSEANGTGTFTNDAATDLLIGNRSSGGRLVDGLFWDARLTIGRAMSAGEVTLLYDPQSRFELFAEQRVPRVWPVLAGAVTRTAVVSLQAALQRQASFLASSDAVLRAEAVLSALAGAALEGSVSKSTSLDLAVQVLSQTQANLDTALIRALGLDAGLDANLATQGASQRAAALDGAIRQLNLLSGALEAALRAPKFDTGVLDAWLALSVEGIAGLDAVAARGGLISSAALQGILRATPGRVAALDAILGLVVAAAGSRTFKIGARGGHAVGRGQRRSLIPSGNRRH